MTIHIATTTPIGRNSKKLIVAALLGAVLATNVATAGVTWRLARHGGGESTAITTTRSTVPSAVTDNRSGTVGGIAERAAIQADIAAAAREARVDSMGGVAERIRMRAGVTAGVPAEQVEAMSGMAELYRHQQQCAAQPPSATMGGKAEEEWTRQQVARC